MKRIIIFSTAYLPLQGGAEIAVKEITDRIPDVEFDLVCAKVKKGLPDKERIGNIDVWRLGPGRGKLDKFLLPWRGARLAARLYAEKKYDAIWAIMASFGGLTALRFKNKFPSVPYILTLQEGDTPEHIRSRAKWLGSYYGQMFSKADCITAISSYLKEYAKTNGAKGPIEVVPNGIDLEKFKVKSLELRITNQNLKDKLGIREGEKIIITVSRLVEKNGIGDLIDAVVELQKTITGCSF